MVNHKIKQLLGLKLIYKIKTHTKIILECNWLSYFLLGGWWIDKWC